MVWNVLFSLLIIFQGEDTTEPARPGFSGMAQVGKHSFVVTHDYKTGQAGPRLAIIEVSETAPPRYRALDWREDSVASDLEAICPVPGSAAEYLAVESGFKPGGGRIFHLHIAKEDGAWKVVRKGIIALPPFVSEVEGAACFRADGQLTLILAERGGTKKNPTGRLRWGPLSLTDGAKLDWPEENKLALGAFPETGKGKARWRACTDLYLDGKDQLWAARGVDLGDAGPFRSAVYRVGRIAPAAACPIVVEEKPKIDFMLEGFKIEGLAAPVLEGSIFSVATDDEVYGGAWRPLGVLPKKGKKK